MIVYKIDIDGNVVWNVSELTSQQISENVLEETGQKVTKKWWQSRYKFIIKIMNIMSSKEIYIHDKTLTK